MVLVLPLTMMLIRQRLKWAEDWKWSSFGGNGAILVLNGQILISVDAFILAWQF